MRFLGNAGGNVEAARRLTDKGERRREGILRSNKTGFFNNRRWRTGEAVRDRLPLAAAAPLYFGIATPDQGRHVARRLELEFLGPGGFVTTKIPTGQQWDAPNGWPPLEWLAIEGVRRYGRADLADKAAGRLLALLGRT